MFHSIIKQTGIIDDENNTCGVHAFDFMLFQNGCDVKKWFLIF